MEEKKHSSEPLDGQAFFAIDKYKKQTFPLKLRRENNKVRSEEAQA